MSGLMSSPAGSIVGMPGVTQMKGTRGLLLRLQMVIWMTSIILFPWKASGLTGVPEATELKRLRSIYQVQLFEARKPVTVSYIRALGLLQKSLNDSGNLDEALLVLQERNRMAATMAAAPTPGAGSEPAKASAPGTVPNSKPLSPAETSEGNPTEFPIEGTKWTWTQQGSEIWFLENGRAIARFTSPAHQTFNHTWTRIGPREFQISTEIARVVNFRFTGQRDGSSAEYDSRESTVKGTASRLPEEKESSPPSS